MKATIHRILPLILMISIIITILLASNEMERIELADQIHKKELQEKEDRKHWHISNPDK